MELFDLIRELKYVSDYRPQYHKNKFIEAIKTENDLENLSFFLRSCENLLRQEVYLVDEAQKRENFARDVKIFCSLISEKYIGQNDTEYAYMVQDIKHCLDESIKLVPENREEYPKIEKRLNSYFSNLIDTHAQSVEQLFEVGQIFSNIQDEHLLEKYGNKVFERYGDSKENIKKLFSMFRDRYIFSQAELSSDSHWAYLLEERMSGKNILNCDTAVVGSKKALMAVLKTSEEQFKEIDKNTSLKIIEKCSEILKNHLDDKNITQQVSNILTRIPVETDIIEEIRPLYKTISKKYPDIKVPSVKAYTQNLKQEIKNLMTTGHLQEAMDKFAYITSSEAYKNAQEDNVDCAVQKMPNGCIAVVFLREKRSWDQPVLGSSYSGIAWDWYGQGFIVEPKNFKVVAQCKTKAIRVRDKYNSSKDFYNTIHAKNVCHIDGNKLEISIRNPYAYDNKEKVFACVEYDPQREQKREKSLAKIAERKEVLVQRTSIKTSSPSTTQKHPSNSGKSSGSNSNGGFGDGR